MNVPVKIKKLHPDAVVPKYAKALDAGFDLYAIEDTVIPPGESVKIRTGIAVALPPGNELQVRPRSGVSEKTKLRVSNAPGTCDAGYRGEICVLIDNIQQSIYLLQDGELVLAPDEFYRTVAGGVTNAHQKVEQGTYIIRKGDRIAQGVLSSVLQAEFEVVDELDETERGANGFGSSGTR
ncbi:deoxyuridine 5'-triphosphate nucleotidohydrolase [Brevibacillus centrosporus]|uniref:dUTP diphosphatase n=1 Tax=Brevibacillus centrosporus TaxID=54910 RepID=UPI002E224A81|nr:deoxyuridine 5'-triphosphate nucleotidohydrolase [Brevibacillus centrosporus]